MKKFLLFSLLGAFVCLTALAQPSRGKYYRINNERYGKVIKENWGSGQVTCNVLDANDYSQIWQYTTNGALQNVFTGKYLQNQTGISQVFFTGTTAQTVTFEKMSDGHLAINTSGSSLHCDAASNVVRWQDNNNEANHWTVKEVSLTADQVKAAREEYNTLSGLIANAGKYNDALKTFFTNDLCTELQASYAAMSDDDLKAAMAEAGLPTMLQDIAVKVKNQWWNDTENSEYADENKYAKDFRVASYKPYSDANRWRDKMNTYAPSFMGNPTGIYATNKDIIHVFVGNDIPEGATLYLTPVRNHGRIGSRSEGTELKKGYNAVIATNDSLVYFVNYVVNTIPTEGVNPHTQTIAKISDFPDLNIHIEGGKCVGYYQKPLQSNEEEDAKFQYLSKNAPKDMYFAVKGATSLFYFKQQTYTAVWPKTIWNSIDWFDRVHFWEFGLIGVLDDVANGKCENGNEYSKSAHPFNIKGGDAFFPTYCNNPTMAIEGASGQNPHATTFYTSYPGTWGVESSFNAERADFDTWCTGHEHGHQIQAPYNLESCSESSVNLPSLLVTYMTGYRMGRGGSFADNYGYSKQNMVFGHRDIGMTMRMYWNLFLYYHVAGNKKDFYPTFVKSLREDPMNFAADKWIDGVGHHRATKTWIHLYKKACDAAQEDLTEYFRLWGFFIPCKELHFGDYTNYYVSLTEAEIEKAIAEVKAKNYPENLQIMFVEDRQIQRERTDIWAHTATGDQKYRPDNGGTWRSEATFHEWFGDVGDVLTYIDGSANTSEYTYILSGNKVTLKGKGGCGFIVYDKDGNNCYMSNYLKFEIPAEVAQEGFTIKAINADGTSSVVENAANSATDEEKQAILNTAIEASQKFLKLEDPTGKKVGFYKSEDLATLKSLVEEGKNAIANSDAAKYMSLAESINSEMLRLQTSGLLIKICPQGLYEIISARSNRYLSGNNTALSSVTSSSDNSTRWAFAPVGEEEPDFYYIQNRKTNKMIGVTYNEKSKIDGVKVVEADPAVAAKFRIQYLDNGKLCLRPLDQTNLNHDPYNSITVWGDADEGSQWYVQLYEEFDEITEDDINELISNTEDLINDVCDYSIEQEKYALQTTDASQPAYLSTNQPDANKTSNKLEKAIDGNNNTFFASSNSNSATEAHHLKVDLGKGKNSKSIQFMLYGNSAQRYATALVIYGSQNGSSWTKITEINNMKVGYNSDIIKPTTAFRYWKFDVTATDGKVTDNGNYPWFTVKEFELYQATEVIAMKEGFEDLSKSLITNCKNNIAGAEEALGASFKTPLSLYNAWTKLNSTYTNLYNKASKIDPTVDINSVEAEGNGNATIYDLSGRKVSKTGNGIYIINGKKVIK